MKTLPSLCLLLTVACGVFAQTPPTERKLNTVAAKAFVSRIQPILTNVCADCHANANHTSSFKLKPYDPVYPESPLAEANLAAITPLINVSNPHLSPLLVFSTKAHGKSGETPLKVDHPAYQKLELWVHWAAAEEGAPVPRLVPTPTRDPNVIQVGAEVSLSPTESVKLAPLQTTSFANANPTKTKQNDPFDPAEFNKKK